MNRSIQTLFIFLFFELISSAVIAQGEQKIDERNPQAMMKATFLFQFAKQSNWINSDNSKPFVIAVYGNDDVYKHLSEKYATQPVGGQSLKVMKINSIDELSEAYIVFIDKSKMEDFTRIKNYYASKNTMLVTEAKESLAKGATINFVRIDSNLKIEINNNEAKKKEISIGKLLLKWSINN